MARFQTQAKPLRLQIKTWIYCWTLIVLHKFGSLLKQVYLYLFSLLSKTFSSSSSSSSRRRGSSKKTSLTRAKLSPVKSSGKQTNLLVASKISSNKREGQQQRVQPTAKKSETKQAKETSVKVATNNSREQKSSNSLAMKKSNANQTKPQRRDTINNEDENWITVSNKKSRQNRNKSPPMQTAQRATGQQAKRFTKK